MAKKIAKKKAVGGAGGRALASIPGYMALLGKRSHGTISKKQFDLKKKALLATLKKNAK